MSKRNLLNGLPVDARTLLQKASTAEMDCAHVGGPDRRILFATAMVVRTKMDGERCLVFRSGRDLNLFAKSNSTEREVSRGGRRDCEQKTTSFVADGEIVTLEKGISSFAKRQLRTQLEHPPADLIRKAPAWLGIRPLPGTHKLLLVVAGRYSVGDCDQQPHGNRSHGQQRNRCFRQCNSGRPSVLRGATCRMTLAKSD
jgi:hypothetical protein